jgi:hypothetical protein
VMIYRWQAGEILSDATLEASLGLTQFSTIEDWLRQTYGSPVLEIGKEYYSIRIKSYATDRDARRAPGGECRAVPDGTRSGAGRADGGFSAPHRRSDVATMNRWDVEPLWMLFEPPPEPEPTPEPESPRQPEPTRRPIPRDRHGLKGLDQMKSLFAVVNRGHLRHRR